MIDTSIWKAVEALQDASAWNVQGDREQVLAALEEAREHIADVEEEIENEEP